MEKIIKRLEKLGWNVGKMKVDNAITLIKYITESIEDTDRYSHDVSIVAIHFEWIEIMSLAGEYKTKNKADVDNLVFTSSSILSSDELQLIGQLQNKFRGKSNE